MKRKTIQELGDEIAGVMDATFEFWEEEYPDMSYPEGISVSCSMLINLIYSLAPAERDSAYTNIMECMRQSYSHLNKTEAN